MTDLIQTLPDIQGCYLITPTGTLGRYQSDRRFVPDPVMTEGLARPIGQFLAELRNTPDTRWARIAIVHGDHSGKPWKSATLALADDVLRKLYPMSTPRETRLTSFQLRHREHSLFRGLELLLDYRDPAIPDIPYFCPVLMYRRTVFADYLPWPDRPVRDADRHAPVAEVVDLLAGLARSQRAVPAAALLVETARKAVVKAELRRAPTLGLIDDVRDTAQEAVPRTMPRATAPSRTSPPMTAVYTGDDDRQVVRDIEERFAADGFREWNYEQWFEQQSTAESREQFGGYLQAAGGYRFRQADELRFFERFDAAGAEALMIVAAKSPVFRVPAGAQLLKAGTQDRWNLYLLDGEVELRSPDGACYPIAGGSPSARRPVAFLKPRIGSVVTRTEVEFLWLYEPMIEAVLRLHPAVPGPAAV